MKKLLCLLLALVMVLGLLPSVWAEETSEAMVPRVEETIQTSKTQSDAVAWARSQIGNALDYDGAYGCQCVDLIYYYYAYLGETPRGGNASNYAWNSLPDGWSRISYSSGYVASPGDIAVWDYDSIGHVAIVESASASQLILIQQNYNNQQYVTENTINIQAASRAALFARILHRQPTPSPSTAILTGRMQAASADTARSICI